MNLGELVERFLALPPVVQILLLVLLLPGGALVLGAVLSWMRGWLRGRSRRP
jgi:hypothetical protein